MTTDTATETGAAETGAAGTTSGPVVLRAADSPLLTVYAWERWGNFINASPGDDVEIPYDAAYLQVKLYTYPHAEIRVLRFHPKVRTHVHVNKTDTILYEWTARRVQFVDEDAAICDPGDVALHPKGVFHHGTTLTPGLAVEFAMEATARPNPVPTFVAGADVPLVPATTADGLTYTTRTVPLGEYVVREVYLPAGAAVRERHDDADLLLVVLSGSLRFAVDGVDRVDGVADARAAVGDLGDQHELGVEDTACAPRGRECVRTALTDVVLLEALVRPRSGTDG